MKILKKLIREEKGVTSIEYALIAVLIAIAIIGGVTLAGEEVKGLFEFVAGEFEKAFNGEQNG